MDSSRREEDSLLRCLRGLRASLDAPAAPAGFSETQPASPRPVAAPAPLVDHSAAQAGRIAHLEKQVRELAAAGRSREEELQAKVDRLQNESDASRQQVAQLHAKLQALSKPEASAEQLVLKALSGGGSAAAVTADGPVPASVSSHLRLLQAKVARVEAATHAILGAEAAVSAAAVEASNVSSAAVDLCTSTTARTRGLHARCKELTTENAALAARVAELTHTLHDAQARSEQLASTAASLRSSLDVKQTMLDNHKAQLRVADELLGKRGELLAQANVSLQVQERALGVLRAENVQWKEALQAAAAETEAAKQTARALVEGKDAEVVAVQRTVAQLQGELANEREQSAAHLRTLTSLQESLMQVTQERAALHMQLAQQSQREMPTSNAVAAALAPVAGDATAVAAPSAASGDAASLADELAAAVMADIEDVVCADAGAATGVGCSAGLKTDDNITGGTTDGTSAPLPTAGGVDTTAASSATDPSVCNVTDETVVVQPVPAGRVAAEDASTDSVSGHKRKREVTPERVAVVAEAGEVSGGSLDLTTDDELEVE